MVRRGLIAGAIVAVLVIAVAVQYSRPVAAVEGRPVPPRAPALAARQLPCPNPGIAAAQVDDSGYFGTCGSAAGPQRMYSTAKLMTALEIVRDHPLAPDQAGPEVTLTQADADRTSQEQSAGESVVQIAAGEQLSELQLLQGLLIPSANNFAEILAGWDAGSVSAFVAKMNADAGRQFPKGGLHFADPSGVEDQTTGLPFGLLQLGYAAMQDPVLSRIVGMRTADLPVAGTVYNVDTQLDHDGVVGIKTGSDPHGQASFVGMTLRQVAGQPVAIYTAVMGVADLPTAFADTANLANAIAAELVAWRISARQTAAEYDAPWGARVEAAPATSCTLVLWPGLRPRVSYALQPVGAGAPAGASAGRLEISDGVRGCELRLVTTSPLSQPGRRYRLTRGF
jgi:serine-type D-Ala-D-Ala carboxypeptidase (penicillin-binding protein 5/6)